MSKKPALEQVTLTFDLHDLPTAQHRAGLAGLILQIDSMGPEGNCKPDRLIPKINEITATTAKITFTRDSMQGVFDDLYAAKHVPIVVANKWPGRITPKPGEFFLAKKDAKGEPVKGFGYDVVQPQAPCLDRHLSSKGKPWLDLWRQMVWAIPRGGNNVRSRAPFIDRANEMPCGEGATAWTQVCEFQEKRAKSQFKTAAISGALMLGAQAVNAESVPFAGRVDQNLLLHFWQVVVMTFVPHVVNKKDAKVERLGFVLAIPDVADLREFRVAFPQILGQLSSEDPGRTPQSARIDLPSQACLEVLSKLKERKTEDEPGQVDSTREERSESAERFKSRLARRDREDRAGRRAIHQTLASGNAAEAWGQSVRAVESYHMFKLGNNVKILSFARVAERPGLIEKYERIKTLYRNPLFRAARIRALIRGGPWYGGMIELFAEYPWPFFIEVEDTPKYLPRFGRDAREQFQAHQEDIKGMKPDEMDENDRLKQLGLVIQRLINKYVEGRAEVKTGKQVKDFQKTTVNGRERRIYPKEFREAQQRVCSDAFLTMRSRHDQDFVTFFAGSVCSVAQFLPPADYQEIIRVLMTNPDPNPVGKKHLSWEDVKAIAMIAVSACSFNVRPREAEAQRSPA